MLTAIPSSFNYLWILKSLLSKLFYPQSTVLHIQFDTIIEELHVISLVLQLEVLLKQTPFYF